jgi:predicted nucleic acid-binding Zn ribbon protein
MPYQPYSGAKKTADGRDKWEIRHVVCLNCDAMFDTRNPNKKYCSDKCGDAYVKYNKKKIKSHHLNKTVGKQ